MVIASSSGLGSGGTVTLQGVDDAGVVVFNTGTGASASSVTLSFDNFVNGGTTYEFGNAGSGGPAARLFSLDMASRQANPAFNTTDIQMTIALAGVADNTTYSYAYKLN